MSNPNWPLSFVLYRIATSPPPFSPFKRFFINFKDKIGSLYVGITRSVFSGFSGVWGGEGLFENYLDNLGLLGTDREQTNTSVSLDVF